MFKENYHNEKFWIRFFAFNIDATIFSILIGIIFSFMPNLQGINDYIYFITSGVVIFLYYFISEISPIKSSLGKYFFKMHVKTDLYPFNDILKRNVYKFPFYLWLGCFNYLFFIFFPLFIINVFYFIKHNKSLYDKLAETDIEYSKNYNFSKIIKLSNFLSLLIFLILFISNTSSNSMDKFVVYLAGIIGIISHFYSFYKPFFLKSYFIIFICYFSIGFIFYKEVSHNIQNNPQFKQLEEMLTSNGLME